jgi:hypothetical protein
VRGPAGVDGGEILLDAHVGRCSFVAASVDFMKFAALPGNLHRCGQVYITVHGRYQVVSIPSRESAVLRPSGLVGAGRGQYRLSVTKIHRGPPPEQGPFHRRGRLRQRVGAGDGGQPVLTRARPWQYSQVVSGGEGSLRGRPIGYRRWRELVG